MIWSLDTHKYLGEIPRKALQILVERRITSQSSDEEIDNAERELAAEGVYDDYESAKGRIRRALFTYFRSYECMDDEEQLTELGRLFAGNKLTIQEMSFASIVNKSYGTEESFYYPVYLLLLFLEKAEKISPSEAFITPYDFKRITECSKADDITEEFVSELVRKRVSGIPATSSPERREMGFDVWAKMLVQAGVFTKGKDQILRIKNTGLIRWMLGAYRNPGLKKEFGSIRNGILRFFPSIELKKATGDVSGFIGESNALQAFLFDGVKTDLINKYIIIQKENSIEKMLPTLGLSIENAGYYSSFCGLERLVGICLSSGIYPEQVRVLGRILSSMVVAPAKKEDLVVENEKNLEEERIATGKNVLLYGVPGSGKSYTIEHEYKKADSHVERIVFHPDYSYSNFVGQIMPKLNNDFISYEFSPGPFTNIMKEAYRNPTMEYLLIIEEINRGNAPAIFGEVFQLLDRKNSLGKDDGFPVGTSEYPIKNPRIAKEVYGDPEHEIRIPSNLSIVATMNTSDQNVFTLDTAFQRRWQMRLIENSFENVDRVFADTKILDTGISWERFCTVMNEAIIRSKAKMVTSEDKRLGAYFVQSEDLGYDAGEGSEDEFKKLKKDERDGQLTADNEKRLEAIRRAKLQNRRFPEKVLKYLWDDAFKFKPDSVFDVSRKDENGNLCLDSLEKVIRFFLENRSRTRFDVFIQDIRDDLFRD